MSWKVVSIVGARPQFVKAAAVSRAFRRDPRFEEILIHTGQHYDANMSDIFFDELEIPIPKYNLDLGGGPHGQMTGRMLEQIEIVLMGEQPDMVLVYGDTNSTAAGALAAAKLHMPIVHVEAGLRSFDRRMPEEINRVVADHLSALLLCPTGASIEQLMAEGITEGVHHVGDVMYDATLFARERAMQGSSVLAKLGLKDRGYAVCTLHRQENTDDPARLELIIDYLLNQAKAQEIIFTVHPRTQKVLAGRSLAGIRMIEPIGYFDLQRLLAGAALALTDSGGLQKEAYFNRVPCITLRDTTEWIETVDAGWNRLWTQPDWVFPRRDIPDYGGGRASEACVDVIATYLAT